MRFARIIESSIERHAIGFDAWIDDTNALPAILIHTYLTYDGGVSSRLLPSTVNQFLSMIDQTKAFMISDDPKVVEIWHKPPGR